MRCLLLGGLRRGAICSRLCSLGRLLPPGAAHGALQAQAREVSSSANRSGINIMRARTSRLSKLVGIGLPSAFSCAMCFIAAAVHANLARASPTSPTVTPAAAAMRCLAAAGSWAGGMARSSAVMALRGGESQLLIWIQAAEKPRTG